MHYITQTISSIITFFKKTIKNLFFSKKHNIFAQETNLKQFKIMKFKKVNDKQMRNVVGRAFIRVVKNHNLYNVFVSSFKRLRGQRMGDRNPFGDFSDFHTLMTQVEKLVNGGNSSFMGHHMINNDYDKIGAMINHLLHFFLEKGGVDGRRLGMYGQEIFDIACYSLYGDKYLDEMDTMNHSAPKPKNDLEAFLVGQFMEYKRKMPDLTWEQFYTTIASKVDKNMFNEETYRDGFCEQDDYETDNDDDEPF